MEIPMFKRPKGTLVPDSKSEGIRRTPVSLLRKFVIIEMITTSFISACAYNRNILNQANETRYEETIWKDNETTSVEGIIHVWGVPRSVTVKTKDGWDCLLIIDEEKTSKAYIDSTIKTDFHGKFTQRRIFFGDPSMMMVGVDGKSNYGFILFHNLYGEVYSSSIITNLQAGLFDSLGMKIEVKFDKENQYWNVIWRSKKGKVMAFRSYSQKGEIIESVDLGLERLLDKKQAENK